MLPLPTCLEKKRTRLLSCVAAGILFIMNVSVRGQQADSVAHSYDVPHQRLLLFSSANFLYRISQGQIDFDSAVLIVAANYKLNRLLLYNEGYSEGEATPMSRLLDQRKVSEAKAYMRARPAVEQLPMLLDLANYYVHLPGAVAADLDSAQRYAQLASSVSDRELVTLYRGECYYVLGEIYFQRQQLPQSKKYYSQAVDLHRSKPTYPPFARALYEQARHLPAGDTLRLPQLEQVRKLHQFNNTKDKEIIVLTEIITDRFGRAAWTSIQRDLLEVLKLQQRYGFHHTHFTRNVMSFIDDHTGDYVSAVNHCQEGMNALEIMRDYLFDPLFKTRMGSMHVHLGKDDISLRYYLDALGPNKTRQTQIFWFKALLAASNDLIYTSREQEALDLIDQITKEFPPQSDFDKMHVHLARGLAYMNLDNEKMAKHYFDQFSYMVDRFPTEHMQTEMPEALMVLAQYYLKLGKVERAIHFAELTQKLGKYTIRHKMQLAFFRFQVDTLHHNYPSAVRNLLLAEKYADTVNQSSQREKFDELQVRYQTEKKEKDIKLLQQQTLLHQAATSKASLQLNAMLGAGVVLVVITLLIYRLYRISRSSNTILRRQQNTITNANDSLKHLLLEKEWLLKEVHHRVKNNLHTIMSLLESQSVHLEHDALAAIRDSKHRVYAMSLIHQKLYMDANIASINMESYTVDLLNYLQDSFESRSSVFIQLELDPVELEVSQAISVGLIFNEALTNALKFAFPHGRQGTIYIQLKEHQQDTIQIRIIDNGIGMPQHFDTDLSKSLGLRLMKGISEDLDGTMTIKNNHGTHIHLDFIKTRNKLQSISREELSIEPQL